MMKYVQNLGKSLMLPVAVLPAAAILMGIGYWIDPYGWGEGNLIAAFLIAAGSSIIDYIPLLFAVGIALGMSKGKDGAAALSGLVAYLVITNVLSADSVALYQGVDPGEVNAAFGNIENAFVGIISGIIASVLYNKFSHVKLPDALAFFSGKRLVPILSAAVMVAVSLIFIIVWPVVYSGLVSFATNISQLGSVGAGLYGFFNRLLIPTGLHHALNAVFWFDVAGINDIGNFWSSDGELGVTGMYQAGFFPIMMFGLPAAALAMYHTAKSKQKKQVASLLMAASVAAFFTGVTEPLEFSFMFLAPALYVVHAVLTGLSLFIASTFGWTAGFGFSAGLVDFTLSSRLPLANQPYMLIVQGLVFAVIYYTIFRVLIIKFNFKTPGREDLETSEEEITSQKTDKDLSATAEKIYLGLGGYDNVTNIDNCATRLRVEVRDSANINEQQIKSAGVPAVNVVGKHSVQVIVGTNVQFVADEVNKLHEVKTTT
ncbi:PTS transporter subunit EIIC [Salipaludibacillus agaradhaerens]|uniref:N-acetylglucosamine-specific PTS transporter subunit IIBC n=1 Tax=Salipaludibacillus agaradhaerens TaxID=76935 RepID=UPI0021512FE8|nr:N-acetylglucosamine-specific PTS transporter subunit IIBC [Salipaludibacillus agaradhaerens]MCR6105246.1 PTS transporter subunit EIIC [Salipaludibacillus agaradhaerens]MCR6117290.1 PTS transporter subunit EIIC [Salipaludibacillus agaradhaerens]UJW56499.1 PTS transporter subunit EIIC [Bacillus sp. A116_S68]